MMKRTPKTPTLAKLAMLLLFAIAAVAILNTTSISAQELGRTITSPFGIARQTSTSESGSEGDTFVDPETGEVGHIIRNPFGVANPEGVDTGIDIPDSGEEEVGGIITNPFGTPSPDGVDTGVDVFDEDEEYLISLPDEETDVDEREPVEDEGNADDTLDDAKELEEELAEATTEKYVPVKDNPIPGRECDTIDFSIVGTCGSDSVTSSTELPDQIPTLRVPSGESFTIHAETLGNFLSGNPTWTISSGSISPCLLSGATNLSTQIIPAGDGPHSFQTTGILWARYSISATAVAGESSCTRILNVEIYSIDLRIDSDNNGVINDLDEVRETNNPGKIIGINNLDINADEIPDFADGFDCTNGGISGAGRSASFTKMELIIPRSLSNSNYSNFSVKFTYDESLYSVERQETHTATIPYCYKPPTEGKLRIWTKDGGEARLKGKVTDFVPGHRVPKNEPIPLNKLFSGNVTYSNTRTVTLYVEAINPSSSSGGNTIAATLCYAETELTKTRDSVKTTAVKVSAVTPNETSDGSKAFKIMTETNQAIEDSLGINNRQYHIDAQKSDHIVEIMATVTPTIKNARVYFEVIDPDDLSPYKEKKNNNWQVDNSANDNLDTCKKMGESGSNYTDFQNACLKDKNGSFSRFALTNNLGKATIYLDITESCSGDNYIVRASCSDPGRIDQVKWRPFDKYSINPPPVSGNTNNEKLGSLQYESKTTIAQTALLVAWKRTYIERANMYQYGATVTVKAPRNSSSLTVDNPGDFSGESSPGEEDGSEITIFLPPNGVTSYDRRIVSISGKTITLNEPLPVIIPKHSGIKLKEDTSCYVCDTSYLVNAFGSDIAGFDGGAFIEFKEIGMHYIPKYTLFSYNTVDFENDPVLQELTDYALQRIAQTNMFDYGLKWFVINNKINTMSLVAAKSYYDSGVLGITSAPDKQKQSFIFIENHCETGTSLTNQLRNTVAHEMGHIWEIVKGQQPHVDTSTDYATHTGIDECIMSYNSDPINSIVEFCLECILHLRKLINFHPFNGGELL